MSDLLRLALQASRTHEIPLAEELQITRLYLELMQKRFEAELHCTDLSTPRLRGLIDRVLRERGFVERLLIREESRAFFVSVGDIS